MCSFLGWKVEKLKCGAKTAAFPQQQQFRAALRCKADSKAEVPWDLCSDKFRQKKTSILQQWIQHPVVLSLLLCSWHLQFSLMDSDHKKLRGLSQAESHSCWFTKVFLTMAKHGSQHFKMGERKQVSDLFSLHWQFKIQELDSSLCTRTACGTKIYLEWAWYGFEEISQKRR